MARTVARWTGFIALGLLLYIALMCALAPARYFALIINSASGSAVNIDQTAGSFWNGNGTLNLPRSNNLTLGKLHWNIHPLHLFRGALVIDWQLEGPDTNIKTTTDVGWHRYTLLDLNLTAPATTINTFYPPATLLALSGNLKLSSVRLELDDEGLEGKAQLNITGAASRMLPVNPLGDYELLLTGRGKNTAFNVNTPRGTLRITGEGEWRAMGDGNLHFEGTVVANPSDPSLEPMLDMLGPIQPDGRRHLKFDQRVGPIKTQQIFP